MERLIFDISLWDSFKDPVEEEHKEKTFFNILPKSIEKMFF